jgi:AmmeMemoRadiSam system protein B/AmmeMemoRadiSam system protein A
MLRFAVAILGRGAFPNTTTLPEASTMTAIRPTAVAGSFYPADADALRAQVDLFLGQARARGADGPVPKAIIAPHAGYIYSGPVAASAYARLAPAAGTITRVVLLGPSHRVPFRGLAIGTADVWSSPLGPVAIDRAAVDGLRRLPGVAELDIAHAAEHSLEVHVPFLQAVLGEFKLVPVVVGDATAEEVAGVLDALWGGPETLFVISTDLSHYLGYSECQRVDAATVHAIEHLDPTGLSRDSACGRVPVGGLLVAAKRRGLDIATLDVRNSGDTAGPRDRVVGYGAWALFEAAEDDLQALGPTLTALARRSIVSVVSSGGRPGAVFVTLKRDGRLRGCIGSPVAWRPLGEDVVDNACKAAQADPRFAPMSPAELADLELSVSVLTAPVPMTVRDQDDLLAQLRPGVDGLIIEDQGRRALFLPSVWEQLPDKQAFLGHLKAKAGMPPDHWSPTFKASRFQAVEIKE